MEICLKGKMKIKMRTGGVKRHKQTLKPMGRGPGGGRASPTEALCSAHFAQIG